MHGAKVKISAVGSKVPSKLKNPPYMRL